MLNYSFSNEFEKSMRVQHPIRESLVIEKSSKSPDL